MAPSTTAMAQMLATAVHTFRALVSTVQGTGDPNEQLKHLVNSMGDMATIFEQFATVATVNDSTMQQVSQSVNQMQQQMNGQATINQQLFDATQNQQSRAGPSFRNHSARAEPRRT